MSIDGGQVGPGGFQWGHRARKHLVLGRRFMNPCHVSGHWFWWIISGTQRVIEAKVPALEEIAEGHGRGEVGGDRCVGAVHPAGGGSRPGEEGRGGGRRGDHHRHRGALLLPCVQLPLQVLHEAVGEAAQPGEDDAGDEDRCHYGEDMGSDHHICRFLHLELSKKVGAGRPRRLPGAKRQLEGATGLPGGN